MERSDHQPYGEGATRCAPTPSVLKKIQKQVRASRALSPADVRLAAAMGPVSADVQRSPGFNDGAFDPPSQAPALALARRASPSRRLAHAPLKKALHALALLVDFPDNPGARPAADFQTLLFDAADPNSMTSF